VLVASAAGDCCSGGSVFLQVVVASVQTAINCLPQLRRCGFGLVVVDEAHHSVASTYKNLLEGLGLIELDQEQQQQQQQEDSMYQEGPPTMTDGQPWESSAAAAAAAAAGAGAGAGGSVGWSQVVDAAIKGEPGLEIVDGNPAAAAGWEGAMDSSSSSLDQEADATGSSVEADDSSSSSFSGYRAVYNPNCLLVGFTATPYRLKRAESRELYELLEPVFTLNITQMINSRVLCKVWELLLLLLLLLAP
jgi:hypothetical protein